MIECYQPFGTFKDTVNSRTAGPYSHSVLTRERTKASRSHTIKRHEGKSIGAQDSVHSFLSSGLWLFDPEISLSTVLRHSGGFPPIRSLKCRLMVNHSLASQPPGNYLKVRMSSFQKRKHLLEETEQGICLFLAPCLKYHEY